MMCTIVCQCVFYIDLTVSNKLKKKHNYISFGERTAGKGAQRNGAQMEREGTKK